MFRIVVLIISGIIISFWSYLNYIVIIINWFHALISGKRHKGLAEFAEYFNTTVYLMFRYMSGVTNKRPFPFTELTRISKFEK